MAVPVASSSANQIAAAKPLGVHISAEKHTLDEFRLTCVRLADQHEIRQPFVDRALSIGHRRFLWESSHKCFGVVAVTELAPILGTPHAKSALNVCRS